MTRSLDSEERNAEVSGTIRGNDGVVFGRLHRNGSSRLFLAIKRWTRKELKETYRDPGASKESTQAFVEKVALFWKSLRLGHELVAVPALPGVYRTKAESLYFISLDEDTAFLLTIVESGGRAKMRLQDVWKSEEND